jgi:hypothetical protein
VSKGDAMSETVYVSPEATAEFVTLITEREALQDRQAQERAVLEQQHSDEIAAWSDRMGRLVAAHQGETLMLPDVPEPREAEL